MPRGKDFALNFKNNNGLLKDYVHHKNDLFIYLPEIIVFVQWFHVLDVIKNWD